MNSSRAEKFNVGKEKILKSAKAAFVKKGFRATTIRDIARQSNCSIGCIYHHFQNKEELISELLSNEVLLEWFYEAIRLAMSGDFPDNIEEVGREIRRGVREHTDSVRLVIWDSLEFSGAHFRRSFEKIGPAIDIIFENIGMKLRERGFPPDIDPRIAIYLVFNSFFDVFIQELIFGADMTFGYSDDQVIKQIADVFNYSAIGSS